MLIRKFSEYIINEGYDNVSIEFIKSKKKLDEYRDFDNRKVIDGFTYLHFKRNDPVFYLWGDILVFDNADGTEVANASYGRYEKDSNLKASVDVRADKRRMGIASNMYVWIEELVSDKLYPDLPHSPSAKRLWSNPNRKFGFDR